jgi:hypothetical protein
LSSLLARKVIVSLKRLGHWFMIAIFGGSPRSHKTCCVTGVQRYRFRNEERTANNKQRLAIPLYRLIGMEGQILAFH